MKKKITSQTYRKRIVLFTAVTVISAGSLTLTGCTKNTWNPAESSSEVETKDPEETEGIVVQTGAVIGGNVDTMLETGSDLFFKYKHDLWRLDKNNDHMEKIKTFAEDELNGTFWIYNNCLYYDLTDGKNYEANGPTWLYKKDLSTGAEEKVTELSGVPSYIHASEGLLYVKGQNPVEIFALKADGTVEEKIETADTLYGKIPEGCKELYQDILPRLIERVGYMPLTNGENLVIADQDGQNPRSVPEVKDTLRIVFDKDAFYVLSNNEEGKYHCTKYDVKTLEGTQLFEADQYPILLQAKNNFLYYFESGMASFSGAFTTCYRVDVKTGQKTQVLTMEREPGASRLYDYYGNFYVTDDAIYCQKTENLDLYLEKTSLIGSDDIKLLETPLYQTGISEIGTVEAQTVKIPCECGERTATEGYIEHLVLKGNTEADQKINQVLTEDFNKQIELAEDKSYWSYDETALHSQDANTSANSLSYLVDGITYLSDQYFCLRMSGYEYSSGAAHGMPFRSELIFDRKTGNRLKLSDIIGNSEAELKVLVSRYFKELSEREDLFFSDAETLEQIIAEGVTMNSYFYLTEDGIVFYYYPYEVAPYAAGFPEVTIPYSEFQMKIEL